MTLPILPGHKCQNVKMSLHIAFCRYHDVKIPCIAALSPPGLVISVWDGCGLPADRIIKMYLLDNLLRKSNAMGVRQFISVQNC